MDTEPSTERPEADRTATQAYWEGHTDGWEVARPSARLRGFAFIGCLVVAFAAGRLVRFAIDASQEAMGGCR